MCLHIPNINCHLIKKEISNTGGINFPANTLNPKLHIPFRLVRQQLIEIFAEIKG